MAKTATEEPLLIHFISDFLRDEALRCEVLKNERIGPADYGLTSDQVNILNHFDPDYILCAIYNELLDVGVDLIRKEQEKEGQPNPQPSPAKDCAPSLKLMLDSAYSAGGVHPRKVTPPTVPVNSARTVEIAGNGFDRNVEIRFIKGNDITAAVVSGSHCDIDLYQRLNVEVTFADKGDWTIQARNPSGNWTAGKAGEEVTIKVT